MTDLPRLIRKNSWAIIFWSIVLLLVLFNWQRVIYHGFSKIELVDDHRGVSTTLLIPNRMLSKGENPSYGKKAHFLLDWTLKSKVIQVNTI